MKIPQNTTIIALGAESVGRFAVFSDGQIFVSENFGDLLEDENFKKYKKAVLKRIKTKKPDVILTDLHPIYVSTVFGEELSKKLNIPQIKVQHHLAHIFSAVGDQLCHSYEGENPNMTFQKNEDFVIPAEAGIQDSTQNDSNFRLNIKYSLLDTFYGIASDGTGFGFDGSIWGGEIFKISNDKFPMTNQYQNSKFKICNHLDIKRIGSLEEQTMIGGDLAVEEPARMLISILSKFLPKENIFDNVKKYYSKNEFELLYSQLQQNFNCQRTTSTGRILDAVSVILGFAENKRNYKHEATKLLEKNSTIPYKLAPIVSFSKNENRYILETTPLFQYLLKNINKDKKRLAATAQLYIAEGFFEIANVGTVPTGKERTIFAAGGMANNKIISDYLKTNEVYVSKKIPRGDEGLAFGQIIYYLFTNY